MVYFVGACDFPCESKAGRRARFRAEVGKILEDQLLKMGIHYPEEILRNPYGKPYVEKENVFFNISHCKEMAVCAIEERETGVDIEDIRAVHPGAARRCFSDSELEILENSEDKELMFFRIWTLKESFVKSIGIGISYPMKTCEFLIDGERLTARGCDGYSFSQAIVNDRFVCSLCVKEEGENRFFRINEKQKAFRKELR